MRKLTALFIIALLGALFTVGCKKSDDAAGVLSAAAANALDYTICDANHDCPEANDYFFFLPPMVAIDDLPVFEPDTFSDGLTPLVRVYQDSILVEEIEAHLPINCIIEECELECEFYIANWSIANKSGPYRLEVEVEGEVLGYVEATLPRINGQGRSLPIKFRIEYDALPVTIDPDSGAIGSAFTIHDPHARMIGGDIALFTVNGTSVEADNINVEDSKTMTGEVPSLPSGPCSVSVMDASATVECFEPLDFTIAP